MIPCDLQQYVKLDTFDAIVQIITSIVNRSIQIVIKDFDQVLRTVSRKATLFQQLLCILKVRVFFDTFKVQHHSNIIGSYTMRCIKALICSGSNLTKNIISRVFLNCFYLMQRLNNQDDILTQRIFLRFRSIV